MNSWMYTKVYDNTEDPHDVETMGLNVPQTTDVFRKKNSVTVLSKINNGWDKISGKGHVHCDLKVNPLFFVTSTSPSFHVQHTNAYYEIMTFTILRTCSSSVHDFPERLLFFLVSTAICPPPQNFARQWHSPHR